MDTKQCSKCGEVKDCVEFRARGDRASSSSKCKACEGKQARKWRKGTLLLNLGMEPLRWLKMIFVRECLNTRSAVHA